jgi:hypothetical protein
MIVLLLADFICSHDVGFLQSDLNSSIMLITADKVVAGRQMIPLVIGAANRYHHHGKSEGRQESVVLQDKTLVHAEEKNVKWTLTPAQKRREKLLQQLNKIETPETEEKKGSQKSKPKKKPKAKVKKGKKEVYVLFHEPEEARENHSAKHALNCLFQLPIFNKVLLNRIALAELGPNIYVYGETADSCSRDLRQLLEMQSTVDSKDGSWSESVVSTALSRRKLVLHRLDHGKGEVEAVMFEFEKYSALMFCDEDHWTIMRKIGNFWWHFDSKTSAPEVVDHVGLKMQQILESPTAACFTVAGGLPSVPLIKGAALAQGAEVLALSGVKIPDLKLWVPVKELLSTDQWKAWGAMIKANSPQNQSAKAIACQMVQVAMKTLLWKGMNQWCQVVLRETQQEQMRSLMEVSVNRTMKHLLFKGWNQWKQVFASSAVDPMTDSRIYRHWDTVVMPSCYTFGDPIGIFPEEVVLVLCPVMVHVCAVAEDGYGECKGAFEWFRVEECQNTNSGDDTTDIFQISISASRSGGGDSPGGNPSSCPVDPTVIKAGGVWVFEHEGDDFEGAFREWIEHHWEAKRAHEAGTLSTQVEIEQEQEQEDRKRKSAEAEQRVEVEQENKGAEAQTEEEPAGEEQATTEQTSGGGAAEQSQQDGNTPPSWNVATKTILTANRWLARTRKNKEAELAKAGTPSEPKAAVAEVESENGEAAAEGPTTSKTASPEKAGASKAGASNEEEIEKERSYKEVSALAAAPLHIAANDSTNGIAFTLLQEMLRVFAKDPAALGECRIEMSHLRPPPPAYRCALYLPQLDGESMSRGSGGNAR